MGLQEKKLQIMSRVGHLDKDGRNAHQGYGYVSESQVTARLRAAMIEVGVTVTTTVPEPPQLDMLESSKGRAMTQALVCLDLTLHDVESGESETVRSYGLGQDHSDKAVAKGVTMGVKYALLKLFLLSTYDDAEADTEVDADPPAHKQARRQPPAKVPDQAPAKDTPGDTEKQVLGAIASDATAKKLCHALGLKKSEILTLWADADGRVDRLIQVMEEELDDDIPG